MHSHRWVPIAPGDMPLSGLGCMKYRPNGSHLEVRAGSHHYIFHLQGHLLRQADSTRPILDSTRVSQLQEENLQSTIWLKFLPLRAIQCLTILLMKHTLFFKLRLKHDT